MSSEHVEPLSQEAKNLLRQVSRKTLPEAARSQLLVRIQASAAVAGAGVGSAVAPAVAASAASVGTAAKLAIAGISFAVGVSTGVVVDRQLRPPAPIEVKVAALIVVPKEVVDAGPTMEAKEDEPLPEKPAVRPPRKVLKLAPQPQLSTVDAGVIERPKSNGSERIERQLIETARTAILRRDAASAMDALEQLKKDFPSGTLIEERDSLEVQALAIAGRRDEAKAKAKKFATKYPRSVFGPVVEAAVNENEGVK